MQSTAKQMSNYGVRRSALRPQCKNVSSGIAKCMHSVYAFSLKSKIGLYIWIIVKAEPKLMRLFNGDGLPN